MIIVLLILIICGMINIRD